MQFVRSKNTIHFFPHKEIMALRKMAKNKCEIDSLKGNKSGHLQWIIPHILWFENI